MTAALKINCCQFVGHGQSVPSHKKPYLPIIISGSAFSASPHLMMCGLAEKDKTHWRSISLINARVSTSLAGCSLQQESS